MNPEHHLAENEIAAGMMEVRQSPGDEGMVQLIVARPDTNLRHILQQGQLTPEAGLVGDRWARTCTRKLADGRINPETQLTLMNSRLIALLAGERERWELAGDNLIVDLDLSQANLATGQRLRMGDAIVEITFEPHNGCAKFSKRFGPEALRFVNSAQGKQWRLRGVHAQVIQAGWVNTGDRIVKVG
jgi:MOSC domain-containing protein YiiM